MTRCRAGDLAKIIRSEAGNEGRHVAVIRTLRAGDDIDGATYETWRRICGGGHLWVVQPLQWLKDINYPWLAGTHKTVFPDSCLEPIRPDASPQSSDESLGECAHA